MPPLLLRCERASYKNAPRVVQHKPRDWETLDLFPKLPEKNDMLCGSISGGEQSLQQLSWQLTAVGWMPNIQEEVQDKALIWVGLCLVLVHLKHSLVISRCGVDT